MFGLRWLLLHCDLTETEAHGELPHLGRWCRSRLRKRAPQQIRKVTIVCACAEWVARAAGAPVQYGENRRQPDPLPNQHQRPISKNKDPQNDMQMFSKQDSLKAGELFQIAFKMLTFVCSSFQLFADRSLSCLIDMAGCEDAKTHVDFLSSNQPS